MFSFKNIVEFLLDKHLVLLSVCVALCYTYCAEDAGRSVRCTYENETASDIIKHRIVAFGSSLHILNDAYIGEPSCGDDYYNVASYGNLSI